MFTRGRWALVGLLFGFIGDGQVLARSTSAAHFVEGAVAGPDIEQMSVLSIRYFAGDGEAIVAARVGYDAKSLNISSVRSSRGRAYLQGDHHIQVDYRQRPLAGEVVDTLYIDLETVRSSGFLLWEVDIFSSLEEEVAHSISLSLPVEEAPAVFWTIEPPRLFQGEQAQLRVRIDNADGSGRALKHVEWEWPAGVVVEKSMGWPEDSDGIEAGASALLSFDVRVSKTLAGQMQVEAKGRVGEMGLVPLPSAIWQIDPLPVVELTADTMGVGLAGTIICTWHNISDAPIDIAALRLDVNASFADIALIDAPQGTQLVAEKENRHILLERVGEMAVGATRTVVLRATPHRPGPFVWKASVQPSGREGFIELSGQLTVEVLWGQESAKRVASEPLPTDLQLMGRAFALALQQQVDPLPVGREIPLYLESEDKSDANWIVEDALLEIFRKRGYRLLMRPPVEGEPVGIMHYRLVSSRVVYSPGTGGWLPWRAKHRREAYGDLMLRLETRPDAMVRWDKRVRAYLGDEVPRGSSDKLGGGTMVKRAIIEADNKAVERGLSFSIIGGLVYIFFIL